jgi:hypothetical protein
MEVQMKQSFRMLCLAAVGATLALAADPNPPTLLGPATGIAPNGIAAAPGEILFTQPFTGSPQTRGIYSMSTGGVVSSVAPIPALNGPQGAENGIAIAPPNDASGFTAGDVFAGGVSTVSGPNDAVYKNGSSTPFIDNISASLSKNQTALAFDAVGTFNGALIVTGDTTITLYKSNVSGTAGIQVAQYFVPPGVVTFVAQASTVAPLSYAACPGCIFVTAMPVVNIDNPSPSGAGEILVVKKGQATGTFATVFTSTPGIPEPESIQFITANSLSCNVGGFTYFASGYATDSQFNGPSTSGAILAWTPGQLSTAGVVGHYLVQNEEFAGNVHGIIYMDAGLGTQSVFSDTTTAGNTVGYQLEDTAIVQCTPATGCPATQGFYHKANHWPLSSGSADGVTWNAAAKTLTFGAGPTYTQAQILQLMPSGSLHTGGVENDLSQFIAAALNLIGGAQHNATIDGIVSTIAADLAGTNIFSPPVNLTAQAVTDLNANGTALDDYNSDNPASGLPKCSEGSGLNVNQ